MVANRIDTEVSIEEGAVFTDVFKAVCPRAFIRWPTCVGFTPEWRVFPPQSQQRSLFPKQEFGGDAAGLILNSNPIWRREEQLSKQ